MFTDKQKRQFEGLIVLPTVTELKAIGVDLGSDLPKMCEELQDDPVRLGGALYIVHRESCDTHKITAEEFGRLLDGDTLPVAVDSLMDAIINFSRPATRDPLRKLFQKSQAVESLMIERMNQAVDKLNPEEILSTLLGTAGDSQESSASTSVTNPVNSEESASANST